MLRATIKKNEKSGAELFNARGSGSARLRVDAVGEQVEQVAGCRQGGAGEPAPGRSLQGLRAQGRIMQA